MRGSIRGFILGFLVWLVYRTLSLTWRLQVEESSFMKEALQKHIPIILAHWHGDEIPLVQFAGHYRIATIVSNSKDGDMMNVLFHLLGGKTTRGSSTRGAVNALKGLIRHAKNGFNTSFAVDGPKGPIHVVKPGVFEVSRLLFSSNGGGSIFVAGVACNRAWKFPKAWNKAYLPKPFAKINIVWIGPFGPINKDQDARSAELANSLAEALHKAHNEASKKVAVRCVQC